MTDKKMTKEQAQEMYDNLYSAMQKRLGAKTAQAATFAKAGGLAGAKASTQAATQAKGKAAYGTATAKRARASGGSNASRKLNGQGLAVLVVALLGCAKITVSALIVSGATKIEEAQAVVVRSPVGPKWSKEEVKVLTALDARRVELDERGSRVEKREEEFNARERELAVRLTELKDLSERLKLEREKGDKQRDSQLEQLANVYGSMNPPEAAHLLEQLDINVSLSLIERMPEKRMGQILALMNPQRALELTNLLSKRKG